MRKRACHGKVQYWALGISVVIHAVALGIFTGVRISSPASLQSAERPVSMRMIETVLQQPIAKPKPKVQPVSIAKLEPKPETKPQSELQGQPLIVEKKAPAEPEPSPPEPEAIESSPSAIEGAPSGHEVEFFGQVSVVQRICYVVDCSGSMYGRMYHVKKQLSQSIMKLDPQQAFCVFFFMDGRQVLMTGSGRLESATVGTKSHAMELIDKIKPAGSTDAAYALECAMQLRDGNGHSPEVIYFLTDGFDLDYGGSREFTKNICDLRKSMAPSTVVHTIGFWPQKQDRQMLETLAQKTGGDYIEVQRE